jgi:uncharacterized repeat protein (TIGR01451 family)
MARKPLSIRRRFIVLGATTALLFSGFVGTPGTGAQVPPAPGTPSLFNLEHVFNFNPVLQHDPGIPADPTAGSDVTFWTHSVPLRDYTTGAFIDEQGNPLPAGSPPVMAERDFAVVGSFQRGGYVFDITDPENPAFVTQVTCRQPRNDVGVKKFVDPATGETRVILALTQQTGNPCGEDGGGVGVRVNAPGNLAGFYGATQWVGTAAVAGQTADFVYAGTGCTPAQYVGIDVAGKIALVDKRVGQDPADQCPSFTFKQKMDAAETAGAIGLVQVDEDDPPSAGNAVASGIPGLEITNSDGVPIRNAVLAGTVNATLTDGPSNVPLLGTGSGGIGVFDVTDPFEWIPMYRFRTGNGGVHNFVFHPTAPYGYVSNGALPGGINVFPIIDFSDLDNPVLRFGPMTVGGHHDVTISLDETRAYVGSEDVWRIYDITDPANPATISDTPNTGTYSHGVFTDSDREIALNNNESLILGGFLAPGVCPGEGLTAYDISGANEDAPIGPVGEYLPNVTGNSPRPCTSHFGFFSPKEEPEIMSIGWYVAGVRVIDWSNPSVPVEIAHAVMNDAKGIMNTWAAKFYKGPYIYTGDIDRGFDVFKWTGPGPAPWEAVADLALLKTGPSRAPTARSFTYTVSVTNDGPDLAAGVLVTDDLPESVSFVSATPSQGSCGTTGLKVNCDLGVLASGGSATVDIVVKPRQAGTITNTATVTSLASDPNPANDSDSVDTSVCRITSRPTSIPCP